MLIQHDAGEFGAISSQVFAIKAGFERGEEAYISA